MSIRQLGGTPIPCDLRGATIQVVAIAGKTIDGRPESEQKKNDKGLPLWSVDAFVTFMTGELGTMSVTIPSAQKPTVLGPARLEGLKVGQWISDSGRSGGLYWQATAVYAAKGGE